MQTRGRGGKSNNARTILLPPLNSQRQRALRFGKMSGNTPTQEVPNKRSLKTPNDQTEQCQNPPNQSSQPSAVFWASLTCVVLSIHGGARIQQRKAHGDSAAQHCKVEWGLTWVAVCPREALQSKTDRTYLNGNSWETTQTHKVKGKDHFWPHTNAGS